MTTTNLTDKTFADLFDQLGLDSDPDSITNFMANNSLPEDMRLDQAPFWTEGQRQFLREAWHQDADWVVVIDQFSSVLRRNSPSGQ